MEMDSASQELYFQKVQELVEDDDKIVTVSSLATYFGISIQNSRNIISKYVEDQRKLKPNELTVTYVISGTLKDNGKKGVFMAKENDLEQKRKLFEAKPWEVIYSVQKNKNVDFNIIALVDMLDSTNIRETALHGSIVSKNCVKRTLKFKKLPSPPPPTIKGKSAPFAPKTEITASSSSDKSTASPKGEQKVKTGGIADLFKAAASKPRNGTISAQVKPTKVPAKSGGLAGFLANGALTSPKTSSRTEFERKESDLEQVSNNSEIQSSIKDEKVMAIPELDDDVKPEPKKKSKLSEKVSEVNHQKKKNGSQDKQKGSKRQRDKSKELPSKKRKRIIERNDSDSDDMFEKEDNDDDIIEKSDEEPERIPSSPVVQKPIVPKNKRRKAVTKTYEDEEGFIVTKTEYVYETASEDENMEPEPPKQDKKEEKTLPKSKVTEKKKLAKNQSTLMNFFKKK